MVDIILIKKGIGSSCINKNVIPFCHRDDRYQYSIENAIIISVMQYTILIMPQEEGGYTVLCLELPGAICQGETVDQALDNIKEAIELLLDVLQDDLKDKLALSTTQITRIEIAHVS